MQGEIECRRRRPFSYVRRWCRQGFREIDKYPPQEVPLRGRNFAPSSRSIFVCCFLPHFFITRVFTTLEGKFVFQMCRSMHLKECGTMKHSSKIFRRYRLYLRFRFLGKRPEKKNSRNYLKWNRFKNFLSRYWWYLKVSGHLRTAKPST